MGDQPVGFIGVGNMGGAIAERMLQAGHQLVVHDHRDEAVQHLTAHGALPASTAAEVGRRTAPILLCLPNADIVEQLIFADGGLAGSAGAGAVIIDLTTGDPGRSRRFAERLAPHAIGYVDAPVTGGLSQARRGQLTVFAGGDREVIERFTPLLSTFAHRVIHLGEVGRGNAIKLINNMVAAGTRWLTVEAVALATHLGIDAETAVDALNSGSGRSFHTDVTFPKILLSHDRRQGASFATYLKDLSLVHRLAAEEELDLPLASYVERLYGTVAELAGPDSDISAMVDHIGTAESTPQW